MGLLSRLFGTPKPPPVQRPYFTTDNAFRFFKECLPYLNAKDGPEFGEDLRILMMPITHAALEHNPDCEGFGDVIQAYAERFRDKPEFILENFGVLVMKTKPAQAAVYYLMGLLISQFIAAGAFPKGQSATDAVTAAVGLSAQGAFLLESLNPYLKEESIPSKGPEHPMTSDIVSAPLFSYEVAERYIDAAIVAVDNPETVAEFHFGFDVSMRNIAEMVWKVSPTPEGRNLTNSSLIMEEYAKITQDDPDRALRMFEDAAQMVQDDGRRAGIHFVMGHLITLYLMNPRFPDEATRRRGKMSLWDSQLKEISLMSGVNAVLEVTRLI
jgi:hypothetical protein